VVEAPPGDVADELLVPPAGPAVHDVEGNRVRVRFLLDGELVGPDPLSSSVCLVEHLVHVGVPELVKQRLLLPRLRQHPLVHDHGPGRAHVGAVPERAHVGVLVAETGRLFGRDDDDAERSALAPVRCGTGDDAARARSTEDRLALVVVVHRSHTGIVADHAREGACEPLDDLPHLRLFAGGELAGVEVGGEVGLRLGAGDRRGHRVLRRRGRDLLLCRRVVLPQGVDNQEENDDEGGVDEDLLLVHGAPRGNSVMAGARKSFIV